MAQGIVKVLPASTHQQILVGAGNTIYPSLRVLNPNDGVCYVSRNRDCLGTDYGSWDWKIPSQSYGMLPGPFQSAGIFYLDQSGAGRQGEVTLYPSLQKMDEPIFMAIGRAIAAAITTMDIVEGVQPPSPPTGTTRIWSDNTGLLYELLSDGTLRRFVDSSDNLIASSVKKISRVTAPDSTHGTLSFLNIPQTFSHLMLIGRAIPVAGAPYLVIIFNNDSAANYYDIGTVMSGPSSNAVSESLAGTVPGGVQLNSAFKQNFEAVIYSYIDSGAKHFRYETLYNSSLLSGGTRWDKRSGMWNNVNAINRIDLILTGGAFFTAGDYFDLYGLP